MLRHFANHGLDYFDDLGEILMVADASCPSGNTRCIRCARRLSIFVIDINQIDIARDIELARAQFAHANDPQHGFFAVHHLWRAMAVG